MKTKEEKTSDVLLYIGLVAVVLGIIAGGVYYFVLFRLVTHLVTEPEQSAREAGKAVKGVVEAFEEGYDDGD